MGNINQTFTSDKTGRQLQNSVTGFLWTMDPSTDLVTLTYVGGQRGRSSTMNGRVALPLRSWARPSFECLLALNTFFKLKERCGQIIPLFQNLAKEYSIALAYALLTFFGITRKTCTGFGSRRIIVPAKTPEHHNILLV